MNTSVRLDFLLHSTASKATPQAPTTKVEGSGFKQQYEQQLQAPTKQAKPLDGKAEPKEVTKKGSALAVDRSQQAEPKAAVSESTATSSGESLPITEEARKFLAALPEEEQQQILEEVRQWLASLSPQELQELQTQLAENPEQLIEQLPKALQATLAKLQGVDVKDLQVPEGFTELLASLSNAGIDFQKVAAIQLQAGAVTELKLVLQTSAPSESSTVKSETLAARSDALATLKSADKVEASLTLNEDKRLTKQQSKTSVLTKEQPTKSQDKLNELISSLDKASAQGVTRTGNEALNQLLQAAGMGVTGTQAAGAAIQTVARLAAGFSSVPFMMQAAADSNAQALANRISLMNAKNMQVAEMRLDPPHLGSVRVQIRMQGEQASIVFQAPNAHARELLEQSLPKLREMMETEGLMLADAQVSEESFSGQEQDKDKERASNQYAGSNKAGSDEEVKEVEQIPLLTQPLGLIDYYA